jgi:hypothetical protein
VPVGHLHAGNESAGQRDDGYSAGQVEMRDHDSLVLGAVALLK